MTNIVKKIIGTATKERIDTTNTGSERVKQKAASATGDVTGNKVADKILALNKVKT